LKTGVMSNASAIKISTRRGGNGLPRLWLIACRECAWVIRDYFINEGKHISPHAHYVMGKGRRLSKRIIGSPWCKLSGLELQVCP
jgi:hypothetical protein